MATEVCAAYEKKYETKAACLTNISSQHISIKWKTANLLESVSAIVVRLATSSRKPRDEISETLRKRDGYL